MLGLSGVVVAQDAVTAACGVFSAGYFAGYWWRGNGSRPRRIGAAALIQVSVAAASEAFFSQWLFWSQDGAQAGVWALVRLPLFAATLLVFAIVVRRLLA